MDFTYALTQDQPFYGPQPHPYLHDPVLYVSNLPAYISEEILANALAGYGPFRPRIVRDGSNNPLSGSIEFKFLEKGLSNSFITPTTHTHAHLTNTCLLNITHS